MSLEHFLIRLKIYSSRLRFGAQGVLIFFLLLIFGSSCSSRPAPSFKEQPLLSSAPMVRPVEAPKPPPVPPWQVWSADSLGERNLEQAERFAAEGKLREAVSLYDLVTQQSPSPVIQESALLRSVGTRLKLGEAKEALSAVTTFVQSRGKSIGDLRPHLSYVVAYGYLAQGDFDQALAWLSLAYRKAGVGSEISQRAERDAKQIIRGVLDQDYDRYETRWVNDPTIAPLFATERERRKNGGTPEKLDLSRWFHPSLYRPGGSDNIDLNTTAEEFVPTGSPTESLIVGVLLPLTGRFAEHGKRVREGIEFAFEEYQNQGGLAHLVIGDSGGDASTAVAEYTRFVQQERVAFVFGPLLVKTATAVAEQSRIARVPILTFSKREGIPAISPYVFRLGATAQDQITELLSFAVEREGLKSFAAMYPLSETGMELVEAFRKAASPYGVNLAIDIGYDPGDRPGLERAIKEMEITPPQALFVADSIESTWPILEVLQNSPLRDIPVFGPAAWDDPVALRGYASLLENAVYVTPYFAQSADPEVRAFTQRFRDKYGHEPGLLGAQGFDAARLFISSLKSNDFSPETLKKNLAMVDSYLGVTGKLRVLPERDIARRMSVVRLVGGEPRELIARGEPTGYLIDEENTKVEEGEKSRE